MFETVVPETVAPRSRRLLYETLPLSIALHAIAGGAILVGTVWNVVFPTQSPKLYAAYQLLAAPPPPPPPPPPPVARRVVTPQTPPVKMPFVAPNVIPDEIPVVTSEPVEELPALPAEVDSGQAGGVEGGVEGGEVGGTVGSVAPVDPGPPPNPEVIQVKRDDPLPVGAIAQEYPGYPEYALKRNWEDSLVVRYTIGKDGRIKEVTVISPPEREEFSREAIAKIRHWRFHPYRNAEGEPKEVVHELTVNFKIVRKRPGVR